MIESIDPYTGEVLATYPEMTKEKVAAAIARADKAFQSWRRLSVSARSHYFMQVSEHLKQHQREFALLMCKEMGKPLKQAEAEVEKCAWLCEFYAANAEAFLEDDTIETEASHSYVSYEPLGVILGVMPWNYPFWQVFRFLVPTLISGNTALLKHASNVMGCAAAIEQIFHDCGFPDGVFQQLPVKSDLVAFVLSHESVRGVSLTGSEKAGRAVAEISGREIKTSLLELGGSNAFIVLDDADLEKAVTTAIQARYQNTGQSCIAAKRLLLHEEIAERFMARFLEKVKLLKSGDPKEEETYIGVMAREDLAVTLEDQLQRAVSAGAEVLCGGIRKGAYFEPTVIRVQDTNSPVMQEETFGPLVAVSTFSSLEEAVTLSNSTGFGLGVTLFTEHPERILPVVGDFKEGAVFINELVKSDPRLPFGGVKNSGYGRELGLEGIRAFVNKKTVYIQ